MLGDITFQNDRIVSFSILNIDVKLLISMEKLKSFSFEIEPCFRKYFSESSFLERKSSKRLLFLEIIMNW